MGKVEKASIADSRIHCELCSNNFPARLCHQGGINKDPTVGLDGARPPPKNVFKNNMT